MFQTDLILYVLKHTWFHKGHYKKKEEKKKNMSFFYDVLNFLFKFDFKNYQEI